MEVSNAFIELKRTKVDLDKTAADKRDLQCELNRVKMMRDVYKEKTTEMRGVAVRFERMIHVGWPLACCMWLSM